MNLKKWIFIGTVLLVSCQTQKKEESQSYFNGYWQQQGEGEIVSFNDSLVTSYYYSQFNCYPNWQITREYFDSEVNQLNRIDENTFSNSAGFTKHIYKRLKEKPALCQLLTETQKTNNTYNFETLWHTFNEQYAFFKERNIDWRRLKEKYQKQFTDETPAFEFFLVLEKMILELNDEHSDIDVPEEFSIQWRRQFKDKDTTNYQELAQYGILKKYVKGVKEYNDEQFYCGLITPQLGYIHFNHMEDEEGIHEIAEAIKKQLQNTDYCIIDLRFNGGGYDQAGLDFLSNFINKPYKAYTKKRRFKAGYAAQQTITIEPSENPYTKPVYLLTSVATVSAAETAVLATLNFTHFKRVGANTNGALSDMLEKKLPNGWLYTLSNEVYETMNGDLYEVTGIPPDYSIDYPGDEDEFYKYVYHQLESGDEAIEKIRAQQNNVINNK